MTDDSTRLSAEARRAFDAIERWGFLLLQDAKLPSLAALIAGEPVRGSWWGHSKGKVMFRAAGELDQHGDLLSLKLIDGKVTFMHRRYWPAIVAIGCAREDWQLAGLSSQARSLLAKVDNKEKCVRAVGEAARQLERALLVISEPVHTESGAHALNLMTWQRFARKRNLPLSRQSPQKARAKLEKVIRTMNAEFGARARLPWQ